MAASQAPEIMLAEPWKGEDPTGYWVSEKLDGVCTLDTEPMPLFFCALRQHNSYIR
jgi:hypothetical protein